MMEKSMFRDLTKADIDVRVASIKETGLSLLLYKDARVDMDVLDETVGAYNWKREHQFKDGKLYCTVYIYDAEKQEWIGKEDVGTESNTEQEKGQASDSFKRACFNWGIGRELYTAPYIWISSDKCNIKQNGGRFSCYDKFVVDDIEIKDKIITKLSIRNGNDIVYTYGKETEKIDELSAIILGNTLKELLDETQITTLLKQYKVTRIEDLTQLQYGAILQRINQKGQ